MPTTARDGRLTDKGQTARQPRAGVAGRAALLTLRTVPCAIAVLVGLLPLLLHDAGLAIVLVPAGLTASALFSWSYVRAVRHALGPPARRPRTSARRSMKPSHAAAAAAWFVAVTGFVVYLASVNAFMDVFGSVGTGVVLLMWLTLFSVLHYSTPDLRIPAPDGRSVRAAAAVVLWLGAPAALVLVAPSLDSIASPYRALGAVAVLLGGAWAVHVALLRRITVLEAPAPRTPVADRVDLIVTPSAALRNATAQGRMMSILGARATGLSDREVDIMDWGFAFGVAWAMARDQDPGAPDELVSMRALGVTQAVFEAYRGRPAPALNGAVA